MKKTKKTYPIINIPADGQSRWIDGSYCMIFVYSKYKDNFIVKGYLREVQEYLKKNHTHYFAYLSMWNNGESRGHWFFWKDDVSIYSPKKPSKYDYFPARKKYQVVKYNGHRYSSDSEREIELEFKRLPKRWIPEFNQL